MQIPVEYVLEVGDVDAAKVQVQWETVVAYAFVAAQKEVPDENFAIRTAVVTDSELDRAWCFAPTVVHEQWHAVALEEVVELRVDDAYLHAAYFAEN